MQHSISNDRKTAPLIMRGTGTTHVGNHRERNEDRFGIFETAGLAFVADGMGGHAAGDVASRIATECVARIARRIDVFHMGSFGSSLCDAIFNEAHERMIDYQLGNIDALGIGTTLTLAWLACNSEVQFIHIVASRGHLDRHSALTIFGSLDVDVHTHGREEV